MTEDRLFLDLLGLLLALLCFVLGYFVEKVDKRFKKLEDKVFGKV